MARQRCVLGAILHEVDPSTVLRNFTALAAASTSIVTTDIPQGQLPELVEMGWKAKDVPVASLQLVPPLVDPADPDFAAIAQHVDDAVETSQTASAEPDAIPEATAGATEPSEQPSADEAAADGHPRSGAGGWPGAGARPRRCTWRGGDGSRSVRASRSSIP